MTRFSSAGFRRAYWISASLTVGAVMAFVATNKGLLQNPDTRLFELSVFFAAWLAIALLLRAFTRRVKGPEDAALDVLASRGGDDP
jgi:hypothetical protein